MQFYRIDMFFYDEKSEERKTVRMTVKETGQKLSPKCEKYSEKIADIGFFFICRADYSECTFGLIIREPLDVKDFFDGFTKTIDMEIENIDIRETVLSNFHQMLNDAERAGYIYDADDVLREFDLGELTGRRMLDLSYDEKLVVDKDKKAIYHAANRYFTRGSLIPELDRIFASEKMKKFMGHPVDYIIESDDYDTRDGVYRILLQALYSMGRVINRRYCVLDVAYDHRFSRKCISVMYRSCVGGAIVINLSGEEEEDEDLASGSICAVTEMCDIIKRYSRDVLTIICMPKESKKIKDVIYENIGNCTFVEISEAVVQDDTAVDYLKNRAREFGVRSDKSLLSEIETGHGYLAADLNTIFDKWYCQKLKTSVFGQYKDIESVKTKVKEKKVKGSAYEELESMIGLDSAKKVLHQMLNSCKAQKLFKEKGIVAEEYCNHMIFTGNPGTAKTTVARLFAKILKDNSILSRGHLIEVGRGDLVGRYVGWTAPTIQKKFREASGGVLFIDEAYSLVDDRDGSYGDEAINTIVQEMENHRDDVIVIFAGYPDKMEGFLDKNPGLRSRIAHYVHFEDYTADELCSIATHIAGKKGLVICDEAMTKLHGIMEEVSGQHDFGNGRYVRNIIEKAKMAQNSRLVSMDYETVTRDDVKRILPEDIEAPRISMKKTTRCIGFAS